MKISKVVLYEEPSVPSIRINELADFLEDEIGAVVEVRRSFFEHFGTKETTLRDLASCRIFNPYIPFVRHEPTTEEMDSEELVNGSKIVLYDGFELQNVLRDSMPEMELSSDIFHLIFTTRLTCSYDEGDYRYHGRALICSNPSLISTTGIIEAPAKPRDYYLKIHEKIAQGLNLDAIKTEFDGRFLQYDDPRLGIVARGYAMQAIFYYLTGTPFCESKECLLYNAHWQEDLLHAQVEIGRLCTDHQKVLDKLRSRDA
ncbi:MAG TPA: DUF6775 family putative metallopeptidase [Candidatus Nitrosotalea sp.]|nr:DUF6775 family putative metallopeptidase [Candidatus Nitrosotalea sp.]